MTAAPGQSSMKELFYTSYADGPRISTTYLFFTDGTYRCEHWEEGQFWHWKIDEEKGLVWSTSKCPQGWNYWDRTPVEFGRTLEAQYLLFMLLEK
jgi:hypothetical protein